MEPAIRNSLDDRCFPHSGVPQKYNFVAKSRTDRCGESEIHYTVFSPYFILCQIKIADAFYNHCYFCIHEIQYLKISYYIYPND